eukprot:2312671-Prymnesium_polylepis.1
MRESPPPPTRAAAHSVGGEHLLQGVSARNPTRGVSQPCRGRGMNESRGGVLLRAIHTLYRRVARGESRGDALDPADRCAVSSLHLICAWARGAWGSHTTLDAS